MIREKLDKVLAVSTLKHMGIKKPVPGFNIGIPLLSSVFLIHQREKEIVASNADRIERYNSETLMDDLIDIGVPVNINYAIVLEQIQKENYISIDEDDWYYEERLGSILIRLFSLIYPTMPGLGIIAYFNQTAEEIESGRKSLELAIEQVNNQLQIEGIALNLTKLNKSYLLGIKKIVLAQSRQAPPPNRKHLLARVVEEREKKRAQALETISDQMAMRPYLPVLPVNEQLVKDQINQKFSTNLDISEIILSDMAMVLNILKAANLKSSRKKLGTISHAIMLLGHEELKNIVNKFVSLETIKDPKYLAEFENNYFSAFMGYRIAVNYLSRRDIMDFEEISICAMIHNLGQIIVLAYYPEAYFEIKNLIESKNINKRKAARKIIGTTYDSVGIYFANQWGFPFRIVESLKTCYFNRVGKTKEDVLVNFPFCATELCAFAGGVLDQKQTRRLRELINSLNMFSKEISTLIEKAWADTTRFSSDHGINLKKKFLSKIAATG